MLFHAIHFNIFRLNNKGTPVNSSPMSSHFFRGDQKRGKKILFVSLKSCYLITWVLHLGLD